MEKRDHLIFKQIKAHRQVETPKLMAISGDNSTVFAEAPLVSTANKNPFSPGEAEEHGKVQNEPGTIERNFKLAQDGYSADVLQLSVAGRYIERLLGNPRIARHLAEHHADIVHELTQVVEERALASA